ncbi:MAG: gamma carbonic anhydrase family protein [Thermoplasmata archaeon]|nr:gamma carbonic anhydrase family protein [Thermoplasmata archaeon]
MAIYTFEGRVPQIGEGSFVHELATVIGDVRIGKKCFIAPGAVLRGDYGTIILGDGVSVEDNVVIHARPGEMTKIGDRATLGHGCVIHNCEIGEDVVVGMGAVVSDYAKVGRWAVVAEGAVVKNRDVIEDETIVAGIPAKPIGKVNEAYKETWSKFKGIYSSLASKRYPEGLKRID